LDVFGQVFAISEASPELGERIASNITQISLHMGEGHEEAVQKDYDVLEEGSDLNDPLRHPLGKCFFSPLMFSLTDKFGANWCMFI